MLMPTTVESGRTTLRWAVIALAAAVFAGTLAVMAVIAGWSQVTGALRIPHSWWLALALVAEVASFAGYVLAYRTVAKRHLSLRRASEYVAIGFGAFLAKGGAELDTQALRHDHDDDEEGETRVVALDVLEHAPLAPAAWASAVALLAAGSRTPGLDFTLDWAILVPVGAVLALYGVRHRDRFRGCSGWRGWLGRLLEGIHLLFEIIRNWRQEWPALLGATVYWAGDVACLWACLAPLRAAPSLPAINSTSGSRSFLRCSPSTPHNCTLPQPGKRNRSNGCGVLVPPRRSPFALPPFWRRPSALPPAAARTSERGRRRVPVAASGGSSAPRRRLAAALRPPARGRGHRLRSPVAAPR
jgi:hypothetical protein